MANLFGCLGMLFITIFLIILLPVIRLGNILFGFSHRTSHFTSNQGRKEQQPQEQQSAFGEQKIYKKEEGEYVDFEDIKE